MCLFQDYVGLRGIFAVACAVFTLPVFGLLAFTFVPPLVSTIWLGITYSFAAVSLSQSHCFNILIRRIFYHFWVGSYLIVKTMCLGLNLTFLCRIPVEHVAVHSPRGASGHSGNSHGPGHLRTDDWDWGVQSGCWADFGHQV